MVATTTRLAPGDDDNDDNDDNDEDDDDDDDDDDKEDDDEAEILSQVLIQALLARHGRPDGA
jgi:hypothetical protein